MYIYTKTQRYHITDRNPFSFRMQHTYESLLLTTAGWRIKRTHLSPSHRSSSGTYSKGRRTSSLQQCGLKHRFSPCYHSLHLYDCWALHPPRNYGGQRRVFLECYILEVNPQLYDHFMCDVNTHIFSYDNTTTTKCVA